MKKTWKWFVVIAALFLAGSAQLPTEQKAPDSITISKELPSKVFIVGSVCGRLDGKIVCVCGDDVGTLFQARGRAGAMDVLDKPTIDCGAEIPKAFEKFDAERKLAPAQEPLDKK